MKIRLKPIQDQVVVLFGATSGIGLQTAMKMAEKGARVVIVGRSQDGLMEAQTQVRQHVENVRMTQSRTNGHDTDWMQVGNVPGSTGSGAPVSGAETGTYPATGRTGTGTTGEMSTYPTGGLAATMEDPVLALEADVTNFEQVKGVADQVVQRYGRIDTWVNLAAVSEWALFEDTEPGEFHRIIEVNLLGQAYGAMAALPYLRQQGGALIFVSSVAGRIPLPYQSAYNASKHGVLGLADTLRLEMKHTMTPVSVTSILPSSMNTPLFNKARTRLGVEPEPVRPVYNAGMVAKAIIHAATRPVRELVVGDSGHVASFMKRVAPTLTSNVMGATGFRQQRSSEPKSIQAPDNLYEHVAGYIQVSGIIEPETKSFAPITWLSTHPRARLGIWAGLFSLITFLTGWRVVKARAERRRSFRYRAGRFFRNLGATITALPLISSLPMFKRKSFTERVVDLIPRRRKTLASRVRQIELPDLAKAARKEKKMVKNVAGSAKKAVDTAASRSRKAIDRAASESKKAVNKAAERVPIYNRKSAIEKIKDRTEVVTERIIHK